MATTITAYNQLSELVANYDLDAQTVNLALVTSSYTPDAAHDEWADASANEVATGDGYTTGGATLASLAYTRSGATTTLDANDVTWSALTKTFRYAVAYVSGTLGALTNPVLFFILFDATPADLTITGIDFTVSWNTSGILTLG